LSEEKPKDEEQKKDAGKILLEELTAGPPAHLPWWRRAGQAMLVPALAVVSGLILGGIILVLTSEDVFAAWGESPGQGVVAMIREVVQAYGALFTGSIGDPVRIINALGSGDALEVRRAFNPFLESLVSSTPFIFAGLAVALGFRAGLFNIGAEGQLFVGAIFATFVGYSVTGLPAIIHIPLALLAGAVGGAI
jgi:ABC-type uncharacterized transport system permease subunit